jgi:pimeloyl-ACP methyl ester carboxylesterase
VWGAQDRIIPVAHAHNIKDAQVTTLDGAGHMAHMEKPSEVLDVIEQTIARVER